MDRKAARSTRWRVWSRISVVALFAIVPYLLSLKFGFVYDDHLAIEENPHLRVWPGIGRIFLSDVWSLTGLSQQSNYYRPMFLLAYEGVFHVVGAAPWAFHLLNVLFHAAATGTVFLLTLQLWNRESRAFIAAILFALHPVHVEPVAWIAALSEPAFTLFLLVGVCFYLHEGRSRWYVPLALSSYGMALLWKESAIAFLPIVFFYDILVVRRWRWHRWVAAGGVTLVYLSVRAVALGGLAPGIFYPDLSVATQILTGIANLGFYIGKLVAPVGLSAFYPPEFVNRVTPAIAAVALLALLAAWKLRGKNAWAGLWLVAGLLPVVVLVFHVAVPLADRDLYLPSVGFAWLVAGLLEVLGKRASVPLLAALAVAYGTLMLQRLPDWRDDLPLFEQALRQDPESRNVRVLMASELGRRGRFDEALAQLDAILSRQPEDLEALVSKAGIQVSKQDWEGVRSTCGEVFSGNPSSAHCLLDLGYLDEKEGRFQEAGEKFARAFQRDPQLWDALLHLGVVQARLGRLDSAAEILQRAVERHPTAPALNNLGSVYAERGEIEKAVEAFRAAIRVDPSFELATQNLKEALAERR